VTKDEWSERAARVRAAGEAYELTVEAWQEHMSACEHVAADRRCAHRAEVAS